MSEISKIAGYEKVFFDIYHKHYEELCYYAYRFLKDRDEAEEIVQDIIFKLWEQKELLDSVNSIRSYLYRSVYNRCLNFIKHQTHKDKYADKAWIELKKLEMSSHEEYQTRELEQKIHEAINTLPDRCKEVFQLSRLDGKKNKEISEQLGISLKAVEANITRALSSLRENLKQYLSVEMILLFSVLFSHYI